MTQVHTHYDNLKVARDAPPEVIRAAYKTLCHKFHPDRHGGSAKATQTFQLISSAYDVLSDPERRRRHDAWIARTEQGNAGKATPPPSAAAAAAAAASKAPRPWNGRERRRTIAGVAQPTGSSGFAGLRMPGMTAVTAVLWASVALVGAMLVLLFQR